MSVIELKTRPIEISESVVSHLEELLDAARSGKLVSVAIAGIDDDGCIVTACSETDDFARILGAIARLTYRVNVIQDEVTS